MAKTLAEIYAPRSTGEKAFVAKHPVTKTTDKSPATKDDKVFKAAHVKAYDRKPRHGYNPGDDEKVYGVGGKVPAPNDALPPPDTGSTIYPSGKFEEVEPIDELSIKTLKSYNQKAGGYGRRSGWGLAQKGEKEEDKAMSTDGYKYPEKQARHQAAASKLYHKSNNRDKGVARASTAIVLKKIAAKLKESEEVTDELLDLMIDVLDAHYELDETSGRDFARGVNKNHPAYNPPREPFKGPEKETPAVSGAYNPVAVNKAIESSNRSGRRIGGKEAKKIHAVLKGWRK